MTQLCQNQDERLCSCGDDSDDDILPPDPFYEEVMEAVATKEVDTKKVIDLQDFFKKSKEDEAYNKYTCYDGSSGAIESYDKDEAAYAEEFTNYTQDRLVSY